MILLISLVLFKVAMLLRRAKSPEVYLQKVNEEGFNTLVKFIKEKLLSMELTGGSKKKKTVKKASKKGLESESKDSQSNIAYQVCVTVIIKLQ